MLVVALLGKYCNVEILENRSQYINSSLGTILHDAPVLEKNFILFFENHLMVFHFYNERIKISDFSYNRLFFFFFTMNCEVVEWRTDLRRFSLHLFFYSRLVAQISSSKLINEKIHLSSRISSSRMKKDRKDDETHD